MEKQDRSGRPRERKYFRCKFAQGKCHAKSHFHNWDYISVKVEPEEVIPVTARPAPRPCDGGEVLDAWDAFSDGQFFVGHYLANHNALSVPVLQCEDDEKHVDGPEIHELGSERPECAPQRQIIPQERVTADAALTPVPSLGVAQTRTGNYLDSTERQFIGEPESKVGEVKCSEVALETRVVNIYVHDALTASKPGVGTRILEWVLDHAPLVHRTSTTTTNQDDQGTYSEVLQMSDNHRSGWKFGRKKTVKAPFRERYTVGQVYLGCHLFSSVRKGTIYCKLYDELMNNPPLNTRQVLTRDGEVVESFHAAVNSFIGLHAQLPTFNRFRMVLEDTVLHYVQQRVLFATRARASSPVVSHVGNERWVRSTVSRKGKNPIELVHRRA
jgi:hypothetical protein